MLSVRGLCDELITRPEESYRLCCVVVCDPETSCMRRAMTHNSVEQREGFTVKSFLLLIGHYRISVILVLRQAPTAVLGSVT